MQLLVNNSSRYFYNVAKNKISLGFWGKKKVEKFVRMSRQQRHDKIGVIILQTLKQTVETIINRRI